MKGVILSGGSGTRLRPLTRVTSKQLLPVYNKPMIYYPLRTLLRAGIRDVLIIVAPEHSGDYINLLGSGREFGANFTYEVQDKPLGLAQGLSLAESFADGDAVTMILGDNIFEDDFTDQIRSFQKGAMIFAKQVPDPERFGVVEFDERGQVLSIEEKPKHPKSNYAQTGLYIYEGNVFDKIRTLKPSARGEYEITDLHNIYLREDTLSTGIVKGQWVDAGTFESLFQSAELARSLALRENPQLSENPNREKGPFSGFQKQHEAGNFDVFFGMTFPPKKELGSASLPKPSKKRVLITGGAGFMGSNMIHYLLRSYQDIEIVNFDKLTYAGNLKNLIDVEKDSRYTFVRGDIADQKAIEELFSKYTFDVVINYAAETHVDRSIIDPSAFLRTDVIGTYNLLEATKKYHVERMIQISTDEVFGEISDGEFFESSPFQPNSPYSASKAGGDHLCRSYFQTYKTPVIVTHSCNFYGPYQYPEKLIPLFITNLLDGKKVPLYGHGEQIREWIFTEDHCRAIDILLHEGEIGQVYNIGTGERRKNIEVTKMILATLGKDASFIEHVEDRPGHDVRYAVNSDKIRRIHNWKPEHTFEERLLDVVQWYQDNQSWWKEIKSGEFLKYYEQQYGNRESIRAVQPA